MGEKVEEIESRGRLRIGWKTWKEGMVSCLKGEEEEEGDRGSS